VSQRAVASIVVVDDDRDVAESLAMLLEAEGHRVRTAHDGREGLTLVRDTRPDLVVLDVEMPLLDGAGMALQLLIYDCGLEDIPIVLVSGSSGLKTVAARIGTPYAVSKPFNVDDFLALVARALEERRAPRPGPKAQPG
jgi:DNA-binding NtrC family response regulator